MIKKTLTKSEVEDCEYIAFIRNIIIFFVLIISMLWFMENYGNGHFHKWEIVYTSYKTTPSIHISGKETITTREYKCKVPDCGEYKTIEASDLW